MGHVAAGRRDARHARSVLLTGSRTVARTVGPARGRPLIRAFVLRIIARLDGPARSISPLPLERGRARVAGARASPIAANAVNTMRIRALVVAAARAAVALLRRAGAAGAIRVRAARSVVRARVEARVATAHEITAALRPTRHARAGSVAERRVGLRRAAARLGDADGSVCVFPARAGSVAHAVGTAGGGTLIGALAVRIGADLDGATGAIGSSALERSSTRAARSSARASTTHAVGAEGRGAIGAGIARGAVAALGRASSAASTIDPRLAAVFHSIVAVDGSAAAIGARTAGETELRAGFGRASARIRHAPASAGLRCHALRVSDALDAVGGPIAHRLIGSDIARRSRGRRREDGRTHRAAVGGARIAVVRHIAIQRNDLGRSRSVALYDLAIPARLRGDGVDGAIRYIRRGADMARADRVHAHRGLRALTRRVALHTRAHAVAVLRARAHRVDRRGRVRRDTVRTDVVGAFHTVDGLVSVVGHALRRAVSIAHDLLAVAGALRGGRGPHRRVGEAAHPDGARSRLALVVDTGAIARNVAPLALRVRWIATDEHRPARRALRQAGVDWRHSIAGIARARVVVVGKVIRIGDRDLLARAVADDELAVSTRLRAGHLRHRRGEDLTTCVSRAGARLTRVVGRQIHAVRGLIAGHARALVVTDPSAARRAAAAEWLQRIGGRPLVAQLLIAIGRGHENVGVVDDVRVDAANAHVGVAIAGHRLNARSGNGVERLVHALANGDIARVRRAWVLVVAVALGAGTAHGAHAGLAVARARPLHAPGAVGLRIVLGPLGTADVIGAVLAVGEDVVRVGDAGFQGVFTNFGRAIAPHLGLRDAVRFGLVNAEPFAPTGIGRTAVAVIAIAVGQTRIAGLTVRGTVRLKAAADECEGYRKRCKNEVHEAEAARSRPHSPGVSARLSIHPARIEDRRSPGEASPHAAGDSRRSTRSL